jgi:hypothetical protein
MRPAQEQEGRQLLPQPGEPIRLWDRRAADMLHVLNIDR